MDLTRADRARRLAVVTSAAALVLIPNLGADEGFEDYDTEITPPDYAFAIWAPIFTGVAANAFQQAANPTLAVNRRTGWWLTAAYTTNVLWSLAAQSRRYRYTPYLLPVAAGLAGTAYFRAQDSALPANSTGLLFGWTSVASIINTFALRPRSPRGAPLAVAGGAAALSAAIAASRSGYTSIALASGWGLATSAANPRRAAFTRLCNAAGVALIATATARRVSADRPAVAT
jgi:hypothetical protein